MRHRFQQGTLTEKDLEEKKIQDDIVKEKIAQAEKTKVNVNFFTRATLRLISNSKSYIPFKPFSFVLNTSRAMLCLHLINLRS